MVWNPISSSCGLFLLDLGNQQAGARRLLPSPAFHLGVEAGPAHVKRFKQTRHVHKTALSPGRNWLSTELPGSTRVEEKISVPLQRVSLLAVQPSTTDVLHTPLSAPREKNTVQEHRAHDAVSVRASVSVHTRANPCCTVKRFFFTFNGNFCHCFTRDLL